MSATPKLVLLACCAVLVGLVHGRMPVPTRAQQGEPFVPRPDVARATSIGFRAVLGDYYWLRAVQIIGGSNRPQDHGILLSRLIDVVTTLDPWVDHPYRFAGVWLTEDPELVREANRLLERGIEVHPDDWRIRFYLGFNHFFYLNDSAAAADVLEAAAALPDTPAYLRRLAARLRADADGLDTAAVFLRQLIENTPDRFARAEYEKALEEVETERRARVLDRGREIYQSLHGRDIESVEDLLAEPQPVLRAIPPELHGWEWVIDEGSGRIVSSFYGRRYEPYRQADLPASAGASAASATRTEGER